ncbi:hypothetical protein LCGC14_3121520, partial [marine sediment metagenome]
VVKVIRPGAGLGVTHPSERGLQNVPDVWEIANEGTVDSLRASVRTLLSSIR